MADKAATHFLQTTQWFLEDIVTSMETHNRETAYVQGLIQHAILLLPLTCNNCEKTFKTEASNADAAV